MEVPILLENHGFHYRAWCRQPVDAEATGPTAYDARMALEEKLRAALGQEIETLPLSPDEPGKPWLALAGSLPNDELTQEWLAAIAEARREQDATAATSAAVPLQAATGLPVGVSR